MKTKIELQKKYKNKLQKIGCDIQYSGFTCGTCFFHKKPNLNNNHWRVMLYIRGDYTFKNVLKDIVEKQDIEKYILEILEDYGVRNGNI